VVSECTLGDVENFSRVHKSLYERMSVDPDFRVTLEAKCPRVVQHVQPRVDDSFSEALRQSELGIMGTNPVSPAGR